MLVEFTEKQLRYLRDSTPYAMTPYNQVDKAGDCTCEYDKSGNLKSLSDSIGTMKLQFDALGRLVLAQTPEEKTIHYTYDPSLRRTSKSIDNDGTERYFYLGGYELGAMDEHGNIKALRIPINPNSLESTSILSIELENQIYIPFSDLQRNVRCLVNPQRRNIVESYNFSAFGEEEIFTSRKQVEESQLNNPWRFQSKRHDNDTGLIYYGARYYSPKLYKWISPDPIGSYDSLNLYLFCRNNPLKYYDPWGLASIDENCGCVSHDHPGYHNRPPDCVCICGQGDISAKMSGVVTAVADFAVDTWNNPCFQGGLQAFGGLTEAVVGGGMALGSGGIGAPVGGLVMTHGLDHFFTGLQTAFSGNTRNSVTHQLLQKTGMSSQTASLVDGGLSIACSMGGIAVIRARQLAAFPIFKLPSKSTINLSEEFQEAKNVARLWPSPSKNTQVINGIEYTPHALERMSPRGLIHKGTEMVSRGVPTSVVENAIKFGNKTSGNTLNETVHIFENVRVVTNPEGIRVITVIATGR